MVALDSARQKQLHQGVAVASVLTLILSFFPRYYVVHVDAVNGIGGGTAGVNAWHGYAILGDLLILAAVAAVALTFIPTVRIPVLPKMQWMAITGALGLGTFLILLRGLTAGGDSGPGYHYGIGWSGWILVIVGVVATAGAGLLIQNPPVAGSTAIPGQALFGKMMAQAQQQGQPQAAQPGMVPPPPPGGPVPPPAQPTNPPSNTMQPPI